MRQLNFRENQFQIVLQYSTIGSGRYTVQITNVNAKKQNTSHITHMRESRITRCRYDVKRRVGETGISIIITEIKMNMKSILNKVRG